MLALPAAKIMKLGFLEMEEVFSFWVFFFFFLIYFPACQRSICDGCSLSLGGLLSGVSSVS